MVVDIKHFLVVGLCPRKNNLLNTSVCGQLWKQGPLQMGLIENEVTLELALLQWCPSKSRGYSRRSHVRTEHCRNATASQGKPKMAGR
jgi:hypothetical protein